LAIELIQIQQARGVQMTPKVDPLVFMIKARNSTAALNHSFGVCASAQKWLSVCGSACGLHEKFGN
jgi:hypothetical protein